MWLNARRAGLDRVSLRIKMDRATDLFFSTCDEMVADKSRVVGLFFAILAVLIVLLTVFSHPRAGMADYGEYERLMPAMGLVYTSSDLAAPEGLVYQRPLERFGYARFSYASLVVPTGNPTQIYPITLVRLFTAPFGVGFSTNYLALIYAIMIGLGMYGIARYGYSLLRGAILIPCALLLLPLSEPYLIAYLNSLYPQGMAIACLPLLIAALLRAFVAEEKTIISRAVPVVALGYGFVCSVAELNVFLPAIWAAVLLLILPPMLRRACKAHHGALMLALLLLLTYCSAQRVGQEENMNSFASRYNAAFQGLLAHSPEPEGDILDMGLDQSYIADVGRSFYEPEENFAHNPRLESVQQILGEKIGTGALMAQYLRHPDRYLAVMDELNTHLREYVNYRVKPVGQGEDAGDLGRLPLARSLRRVVYPENFNMLILVQILLCASLILGAAAPLGQSRRVRGLCGAMLAMNLCLIAFLPQWIFLYGIANIDLCKSILLFSLDILLFFAAGAAAYGLNRLYMRYAGMVQTVYVRYSFSIWGRDYQAKVKAWLNTISSSKRATVAIVAVFCVAVTLALLLVPPRAGGVNNGDFGRMMNEIDLIWEAEIFDLPELQAGRQVIETYSYRRAFDPLKLTTLNPTYSLIYPVALVRLLTEPFGKPFYTNYLSVVFSAVAILCIASIVRDLHGYFGKLALPFGFVLSCMLLGEIYLVWFNSLFGEGSIYLGILMCVTACVHLSVKARGKGLLWIPFLYFACRFFLAAKAQMALGLPVALALIVLFTIYHMPKDALKRGLTCAGAAILCGLLCVNTIAVYQKNDEVSAKQTNWQSVFYGLLMISDDPRGDMEMLGIAPEMIVDIGKHAYYPDEEYVYAPLSDEAQGAFYDHVGISEILGYYLRHPTKLIHMLNHAARESVELHDGFMMYMGQYYFERHDPVNRFGFWQMLRPLFAGRSFWHYVVVYGALIALCVRRLRNKQNPPEKRLLTVVFLAVMLIGVLQFPLSVLGNGYADNNKQLFAFMLCHDFIMIATAFEGGRALYALYQRRWAQGKGEMLHGQEKPA